MMTRALALLTLSLTCPSLAEAAGCATDAQCNRARESCLEGHGQAPQCGPEPVALGHHWELVRGACAGDADCGFEEACRLTGIGAACASDGDCPDTCREGFCRESRCVGRVGYYIDPAGSDDFGADAQASTDAVRDAMRSWELVPCTVWDAAEREIPGNFSWDVGNDGYNKFYFIEDDFGSFGGSSTLGVTITNFSGGGAANGDADIVFNGVDHRWTSGDAGSGSTDIFSVALHEIGHFLGLGHPCELDGGDCDVDAIMNPTWSGHPEVGPRPSDVQGICNIYPGVRPPIEDGSLRLGEACGGDCECGSGICRYGQCTRRCMIDDPCPAGGDTKCVLSRNGDGLCMSPVFVGGGEEKYPVGAQCNSREADRCETGLCEFVEIRHVRHRLCTETCTSDGDCRDGAVCGEGLCIFLEQDGGFCGDGSGEPDPGEGCGCSGGPHGSFSLFMIIMAGLLSRKKERPCVSH